MGCLQIGVGSDVSRQREGFGHSLPETLQVIQPARQRDAHVEALDVAPAFETAVRLVPCF
jgi:hypothetical protein